MKIVKLLIATVALSGALATSAHARDSFSIGINIGGHGHYDRHVVRTHRHTPTYYGHRYHRYDAPQVIYYEPRVLYRQYSYYGDRYDRVRNYGHRHFDNHKRKNRYHKRHHRRHDDRGRGNRRYR